jgi:pyruvate,water dikinase
VSDPAHDGDATRAAWTTLNASEALPGVTTPLCWTTWGPAAERAMRGAFADIGALRVSDIPVPDALDERFTAIFHGRFAGNVDMMRRLGDQMPGSSGAALEEQFFAKARTDIPSQRDPLRLPVIAVKLPLNAWRAHATVRGLAEDTA